MITRTSRTNGGTSEMLWQILSLPFLGSGAAACAYVGYALYTADDGLWTRKHTEGAIFLVSSGMAFIWAGTIIWGWGS